MTPEERARFDRELGLSAASGLLTISIVGFGFLMGFAILDAKLYPEIAEQALRVRLAATSVGILLTAGQVVSMRRGTAHLTHRWFTWEVAATVSTMATRRTRTTPILWSSILMRTGSAMA